MKMETTINKSSRVSPALIWTAAISIIVFCAAGAAAFMGWLPGSNAAPGTEISATPPKAAAATASRSSATPERSRPAERQADRQAARPPVPAPVAVAATCLDCGVIESVRTVSAKGTGSGIGAVGGAVAGGVLGSQVGGGRGQDVMTVVGAVGGAIAGNEIEKRVKATTSYAVTVRMSDGSSRVVNEASAPTWRTGDKVRIVDGAIRANG
jgi:outer membrane lipoprotein SlyB